jgi:hypothetical protein
MMSSRGPLEKKLFRYARYNAELTVDGLAALGLDDIEPRRVQKLDSIETILDLQRIGKAVADRSVASEHFQFDVFKP